MPRPVTSALLAAATLAATAAPASADAPSIFGVWRNPKNSVHVEIKTCDHDGACGTVVWASAKAQDDAKKGSGKALIGMLLFRDLHPDKDGVWQGRIFIPDLNRTFAGTAEPLDGGTLRARGCFLARFFCKSQDWKRVSAAAD